MRTLRRTDLPARAASQPDRSLRAVSYFDQTRACERTYALIMNPIFLCIRRAASLSALA
jgi:hypothetical protein